MKLEDLVADGWRRHEEDPQGVHDSLAGAVALVSNEMQLHAFSRLLTHVHAEHLNTRSVGASVLDELRVRFEHEARDEYRPATTSIGILRFVDGDSTALDQLSSEERASALATSASALARHKRLGQALTSFQRARTEASQGLPKGSPALRALAAAGNNLAVTLEQMPDRDESHTAAMVEVSDAALEYWKRAGGWLEEERAHYRCARSRIQAGRPLEAIDCAERCLGTCEQNAAPAYERFFAYTVGALAYRAAGRLEEFERWRSLAAGQYGALTDDDRASCLEDLVELGAGDATVAVA